MPADVMEVLREQSGMTPPPYEIVSEKELWRRKSGKRSIELHGNPASVKEIQTPGKCAAIAEICGILLGDGGISDGRVEISLHGTKEVEYADAVACFFEKLFGIKASIYLSEPKNKRTVDVRSVRLVRYLTGKEIGLKKGNKVKQQVCVPDWILCGGKEYWVACVRGLMDTDGGLYLRTQQRKRRPPYHNIVLIFANYSIPLLDGMNEMLRKLGYHPRKYVRHRCVYLNRQAEIRRYYREIGTRNAYHVQEYVRKARVAWGEDISDEVKFLEDER